MWQDDLRLSLALAISTLYLDCTRFFCDANNITFSRYALITKYNCEISHREQIAWSIKLLGIH